VNTLRLRRTSYEMVWQVLEYCRRPRRLTHIIQSCNFNTNNAQEYTRLLIDKGMLERREDLFVTTSKGLRYVEMIEAVYEALFSD